MVKQPLPCHELMDETAPVNRNALDVEGLRGDRATEMKLLMRLTMVVQGGGLVMLKVAGPGSNERLKGLATTRFFHHGFSQPSQQLRRDDRVRHNCYTQYLSAQRAASVRNRYLKEQAIITFDPRKPLQTSSYH